MIDRDYLSIWEIAHRWHDADPNLTDPKALPLPVQDMLRKLSYALVLEEFHFVSARGIMYDNFRDQPKRHEFIPPSLLKYTEEEEWIDKEKGLKRGSITLERMTPEEAIAEGIDLSEINEEEEYQIFVENRTKRYVDAIENLDKCYTDRIYDKAKLESICFDQYDLYQYCKNNKMELPSFWFDDTNIKWLEEHYTKENGEQTSTPSDVPNRGRHSARDQDYELCRAIASTLWLLDPSMTIKDVAKHEAVQRFGNGRLYKGRDTIPNWINDLCPTPKEKRAGRPKKT